MSRAGVSMRWRQQGQHRIQPQEEEIRLGDGLHDGRIGIAARAKRPEVPSTRHHADNDGGGEKHVLPDGGRHETERRRLWVSSSYSLRYVERRTTRPGMGQSLMPHFNTSSRCSETSAISSPGIRKTWSAKNRESVAPAMIGSTQQHVDHGRTNKGNTAGDGSANPQTPVGILIEAQNLTGEGHAERHQEQENANHPGELAGKLVGAEQEHLAQVDEHHGDHEVGAPAVYGAEEPSQGDTVVEKLQAVPGFRR